MLYLKYIPTNQSFGTVGTPTLYKDSSLTPLFVGDMVQVREYTVFVVETILDGQFVMGIANACDPKTGSIDDRWTVKKVKDFKDVVEGDADPYITASAEKGELK